MVVSGTRDAVCLAEFECSSFEVDGTTITLRYRATGGDGNEHEFAETIVLPGPLTQANPATAEAILRLLHFAASLSYFKAFAPAKISVPSGLTPQERDFFTAVLTSGLGEFAYVNSMPEVFETRIDAVEREETAALGSAAGGEPQRCLVAVGGGKDSIVSIETLKQADYDIGLFSVNSYQPIEATAVAANVPLQSAHRALDPHLFELNEAGAPNGHVPVTAVNSLIAVLSALAQGFDAVVFSNEASSSFGNVEWAGKTINHQWSKGIEFERLLRQSLPAGSPQYFSLLRPLSELRISRQFAQLSDYHPVFTSCNRAFKLQESDRTSWCGDCPKCRFVFLSLAPFLDRQALLNIFGGRDLLADETQYTGFLELLAVDGLLKPFECVGEPQECHVAVSLLREHPDWREHPFLAKPEIVAIEVNSADVLAVFEFHEHEHFLSPKLEALVREV